MKQWMSMEKMGKADKAKGKVVSVVNGGVVCRIIAVSYTHLDVYKRQDRK